MKNILKFIIAILLIAATTHSALAYYPTHYQIQDWPSEYRYYQPDRYIMPARTGLPSNAYFYPNQYIYSNGFMTNYRSYTKAAYSDPAVMYARPYLNFQYS